MAKDACICNYMSRQLFRLQSSMSCPSLRSPSGKQFRRLTVGNFHSTHYRSGEEIHPGDQISWADKPGRVLFVLGREFPADWASSESWFMEEYGRGFMLDTQEMGLVFEDERDEDLQFLGRKA